MGLRKFFKNKFAFILTIVVSVLSVAVGAFATAAWFQIDAQSPEFNNTTAIPNLTIDNANVTGYKINPTLGDDGFPNYDSSTVAHKKGSTYETENHNQDEADTVFDVPSEGLGYYLIKKNPSDTYKYNYSGGGTYAWKFSELDNNDINYMTIDATTLGTISRSDCFIIRKYSYDAPNYKTINTKVDISKDTGAFSINAQTYEITPTSASPASYNIWFNKATKKVTFNEPLDVNAENHVSRSYVSSTTTRAGGATAVSNTVYMLQNSNWWFNDIGTSNWLYLYTMGGSADQKWFAFTDSGYKYNDQTIWKATASGSFTGFILTRQNTNSGGWDYKMNQSSNLTFSSTKNYCQNTGDSNFSQSAFSSVIYDGWVIVGSSTTSGSSFYGKSWDASGAIRLEDDASNLGKIVVDLKAGDKFKMAYMKGSSVTVEEYNYYANNSSGSTRMEVYGGSVSTYFETDSYKNCVVKTGKNIHCTIYFTNAKKINVNITSSLIVRAAKFDIDGNFVEVDSTDAGSKTVTLGDTVTKASINSLSLTIPANYSRVGTDVYTTSACSTSVGTSFTADTNPKYVYIKVQENPITIYLVPYFSNTSSGADGTADNTRKMTLDTQFGANTVISESDLHNLWDDTYSDSLTYSGARYTYSRIETSTHSSAISSGTIANGTTLYVRYVRNRHTVTLSTSYFAPNGTSRLRFTHDDTGLANQSEVILDNNNFSTSKDFNNCQYKDHSNGIWYVFHRADSNWYDDPACTADDIYSGKPTGDMTLYAKMVAYEVTTFYVDADYPGWDNCYLHMWGTLDGVSSSMGTSLTAKAITTDSGNKLYRISIPTLNLTGFLFHAGESSGQQTVDITAASLSGSTSKFCRIAGDTANARTATFTEYKTTTASNVWVQKYNGEWINVAGGQLLRGDGVGNDYILESGLQLKNGDIIRVYDNNTSTAYGYAEYVEGNKGKHTYVSDAPEGVDDGLTISRLGAANATARFNFYVTHAGQLSIAMVPDYGNGYYIMRYSNTNGVENFIGATKMDSSDYSASYDGWYCSNTSEKIYIRSYLNAVDTLCDSLTSTSLSYVKELDSNKCIQFKETGHYNIRVTNKVIDITPYEVDDFFSLNKLNSSLLPVEGTNTEKQQEIWRQKTAIVMEIPFRANNPYTATVQLKTDCSANWIGVRFAVYSSKLAKPYETLHGENNVLYTDSYLTAANTATPISDTQGLSIEKNSAGTFYAYVLIDYRYNVTHADLMGSVPPEVGLYLQIVQS